MREKSFWLCLLVLLACLPSGALGQGGVIIPKNIKDTPDPSILSLRQMSVDIEVDGQFAKVSVLQIFRNHTAADVEGQYVFTMPEGAQVSDFALWEDGVRIPGVIVERKRAREIYEELTYMKIDPGLMETEGLDERNAFNVEVYPIPAHGSKRLELSYTTNLVVTSLRSQFTFPLKPDVYGWQRCDIFRAAIDLRSDFPILNFRQTGDTMRLRWSEQSDKAVKGEFSTEGIEFTEDLAFEYEIDVAGNLLQFQAYRDTEEVVDLGPFGGGEKFADEDGYFAASVVYNLRGGAAAQRPPKDVALLVDTSLSMQWDKLEAAYAALGFFLEGLPEGDRFALVTFNEEINRFAEGWTAVGEESVAEALDFFRRGYLMGGTDIAGALEQVLAYFDDRAPERERYVVLITDGSPTLEELNYARIAERVRRANGDARAMFMVFGIGADTKTSLLQRIADDSGGHFVWAAEGEDLNFKLTTFLDKLGESVINGIEMLLGEAGNFDRVYPSGAVRSYDRSMVTFIGRYREPREKAALGVGGSGPRGEIKVEGEAELPERAVEHEFLPRRWAKLRVDYLLQRIDMAAEGEDVEPLIDEVVALAKRFKFVTPYTSFIAAPRALLRPRAIKPGDPVLRVKTDEAIASVVALFPFGLTKPLHYIPDEDIWETRFLAPKWMVDGTYHCSLLLADSDGNLYKEDKDFTIDSKPPTVGVRTDKDRYLPGEKMTVTVNADRDTRHIRVRLGKLIPAEARYRTALGASRTEIKLPATLPAGTYTLRVTAVDFARNTTVVEVPVEIAAR